MSDRNAHSSVQLMGSDPRIAHVLEIVRRVADAEATVLIRGETGTGKEVVSRAIHRWSPRHLKPFVAVNCASLPRVPAFTMTSPGITATFEMIGEPQLAQKWRYTEIGRAHV